MSKFIPNVTDETIRTLKWLADNPSIYCLLAYSCQEITADDFLDIMSKLEENELYTLIYIILIQNKGDRVLGKVIDKFVIEILGREWQRIGTENIYNVLRNTIREEMRIQGIHTTT